MPCVHLSNILKYLKSNISDLLLGILVTLVIFMVASSVTDSGF